MCGRFTLRTPANVLSERFRLAAVPALEPRYNIAPTQPVAAVRQAESGGDWRLVTLDWGLVPFWAKEKSIGSRMINARGETVAEKPAFRAAFKRRRCLILTDGYYEWKKATDGKQPYFIHRPDDEPFAFAGLWESWRPKDSDSGNAPGEEPAPLESCTIITTDSGPVTADIHDRMPVILPAESYDLWLDPEFQNAKPLQELLVPRDEQLCAEPVSRRVNNPQHEGPDCLAPAE